MEAPVQNEVMFYKDGNVTVSQARFITNSKTYAMRNISSVHIFEIVKSRRLPVILIVIGFLMLFSDSARVAGLVFIALGIAILFAIKNEFAVRISTNSGESTVLFQKTRCISKLL
jgi:hypothetical protein